MFFRVSSNVMVADARAELTELTEAIGPEFDVREYLEEIDTLGGFIFFAIGRIPAKGELVRAVPRFEFQILDADARRIKGVRIVRHDGSQDQDDRVPGYAAADDVIALPAPNVRLITH